MARGPRRHRRRRGLPAPPDALRLLGESPDAFDPREQWRRLALLRHGRAPDARVNESARSWEEPTSNRTNSSVSILPYRQTGRSLRCTESVCRNFATLIPPTDCVSGPLPFTKPRAATVSAGRFCFHCAGGRRIRAGCGRAGFSAAERGHFSACKVAALSGRRAAAIAFI